MWLVWVSRAASCIGCSAKWRNLGGALGGESGAQRLARSARPSRAACGTSAPQAKKILHTYTSPHAVPPSRSAPSRRPLRGSAARVRCAIALRARPAAREASPPTASPSDATHSPPQQQHALPPSSSSCRARDASSAATRGTRSRSRTSRSGSPPLRKLGCPRQRPDGRRSPRTCISTPSPQSCVGQLGGVPCRIGTKSGLIFVMGVTFAVSMALRCCMGMALGVIGDMRRFIY